MMKLHLLNQQMSGTLACSSFGLTFCLFIKIHYFGKNQFSFSVLISSLMFPPLVLLVNTHVLCCCFSHQVVSNSLVTPWTTARQVPLSIGCPKLGCHSFSRLNDRTCLSCIGRQIHGE